MTDKYMITDAIIDIVNQMMIENPDDFTGAEFGNAQFDGMTGECSFAWVDSNAMANRIELDFGAVMERLEQMRVDK